MWQPLVLSLLGTLAGSGLVVLAARKWIEHQYEKALTEHKAKLDRENGLELTHFKHTLDLKASALNSQFQLELENYRNKLDHASKEQHFRFSHVFDKTADAIVTMHRALVKLRDIVAFQAAYAEGLDEPKKQELKNEVQETWDAFQELFRKDRIYIPKKTVKQIDEFSKILKTFQHQYAWLRKYEQSPSARVDLIEKRGEKLDDLMYKIPQLLSELEDDFQRILGFPIDEEPKK